MAKKVKAKVKKIKTIVKAKTKTKSSPKKTTQKVAKKTKVKKNVRLKKANKKTIKIAASQVSLVGEQLPVFSVANSKGENISLNALEGKNIVLYFYPKDDTPGCTVEGHEFSALVPKFAEKNTVVFGVSKDSVESHNKFICKYDYKVELLSDSDGALCDYFDVIKEKNMYGKKYLGIERSTFVIDTSGKIVKEFRKVSPPGHAQFILEQI
jgi:peroxiredoxin Q/BCP